MKRPETDRYKVNRKIRTLLVQHGVDTCAVSCSFTGKSVSFAGRFIKVSGQSLTLDELTQLCQSLEGIREIRFFSFDMTDWIITAATFGSFTITRKTPAPSDGDREQEILVIPSEEPES